MTLTDKTSPATSQTDIGYAIRAANYIVEDQNVRDHTFLRSFITPSTERVLEIPCGAGRNIVLWGGAPGLKVTAVDKDTSMVDQYRTRLAGVQIASTIDVAAGDLRSFSHNEKFDLIVVPQEAFQLLLTDDHALECLSNLGKQLSKDGRLLLDIAVMGQNLGDYISNNSPEYYDPRLPDGQSVEEWSRIVGEDQQLSRSRRQYHEDRVVRFEFEYEQSNSSGKVAEYQGSMHLRSYSIEQLLSVIEQSPLDLIEVFGDYDLTSYESGSPRMICLLRLPSATPASFYQ